jgi:hypothetical protein
VQVTLILYQHADSADAYFPNAVTGVSHLLVSLIFTTTYHRHKHRNPGLRSYCKSNVTLHGHTARNTFIYFGTYSPHKNTFYRLKERDETRWPKKVPEWATKKRERGQPRRGWRECKQCKQGTSLKNIVIEGKSGEWRQRNGDTCKIIRKYI